ncbi:MAG: MraY family glycosyltransferase, partial [Thermodesulfobacteriota bacterium]
VHPMIYFTTLLFSLFTTMALIPILRRYAGRMNCVDLPCERKVHCEAIPRVGGLAMAVGALVPMLLWASRDPVASAILIGVGIIVLFGFLDDARELGYRAKFAAQTAAAAVVVLFGGLKICCLGSLLPENVLLPNCLAVPFTILVIVGVTNAVNLADGLDGLAGGIMMMSFLCIAFVAYQVENFAVALLAVATIGAIFGFLRFNTFPASVFMGDAGSQLLGFLSVSMAIALTQSGTALSPAFPMLLLGLPVMDTCAVMFERALEGRPLFKPDRRHLHHKLLALNLYHREAVFVIYILQAGMVTAAFLLRFQSEWLLLGGYTALCAGVMTLPGLAVRKGWALQRPGVIDHAVKRWLKIRVRDRYLVPKLSQAVLENLFLLVLLAAFCLPAGVPRPVNWVAAGLAAALVGVHLLRPAWTGWVLRALIYFFMPLMIFYGVRRPLPWLPEKLLLAYDVCFAALVFFAVVILKTTRRRLGYAASPQDFIILFIAVVVPNLPDAFISSLQLGPITIRIVVLFFAFEVLAGEMRGQLNRVSLVALAGLMVVVGRWIL